MLVFAEKKNCKKCFVTLHFQQLCLTGSFKIKILYRHKHFQVARSKLFLTQNKVATRRLKNIGLS